jgi:hypothetical protein
MNISCTSSLTSRSVRRSALCLRCNWWYCPIRLPPDREREIFRKQITRSRNGGWFDKPNSSIRRSDQHFTEMAVLSSQIEQLPDFAGDLKLSSRPNLLKIKMRHS